MRLFAMIALALCLASPTFAQDEASYDPYDDIVVSEDYAALPEPVREMRDKLIAATRTGDIENLGTLIDEEDVPPRVSFGEPEDALAYLREKSGDHQGRMILALLRDLLEMPYAVLGAGSDSPNYVWPYLALSDMSDLTPGEIVDTYRLVPPEQLDEMRNFGGWFYWRVYIGADGDWQAFVYGD